MKKLILTLVFVFAIFSNANSKGLVADCFQYAINELEEFEAETGVTLDDEQGADFMNTAYANCWMNEE